MALQLYDTVELMGVIQTLKPVNTFWRDTCFGTVQTFNTEYIDFGMVNGGRRLRAVRRADRAGGKVMKDKGYTTKRFARPTSSPR